MINELERVVLTAPVPKEGLEVGDVGTVVHVYQDGRAFEVEFTTLAGQTVAVITLQPRDVREVARSDIAHAREFQTI